MRELCFHTIPYAREEEIEREWVRQREWEGSWKFRLAFSSSQLVWGCWERESDHHYFKPSYNNEMSSLVLHGRAIKHLRSGGRQLNSRGRGGGKEEEGWEGKLGRDIEGGCVCVVERQTLFFVLFFFFFFPCNILSQAVNTFQQRETHTRRERERGSWRKWMHLL